MTNEEIAAHKAAWEAKWRWDVGTRVIFRGHVGTVTKENPTTVAVRFDDATAEARYGARRIAMDAITRVAER